MHGFAGLILRSILYLVLFIAGTLLLKLSPDIMPVWQTFKKKLGIKKGEQ
jgi:hypothetical protein